MKVQLQGESRITVSRIYPEGKNEEDWGALAKNLEERKGHTPVVTRKKIRWSSRKESTQRPLVKKDRGRLLELRAVHNDAWCRGTV